MKTLDQLTETVKKQHDTVMAAFAPQDLAVLNYKPAPESWSILECLEHLNRYSRYYNPALAKAIAKNSGGNYLPTISYSWFGKKSLEMVQPMSSKKHKTVKHMNPNNSQLGHGTVEEFRQHQEKLLNLLQSAKAANINKKAIPVEFFKLLKLRIGETLEFVVTHQERHLQQALRVKAHQAKQVILT
ncbi:DinB family protein [Pontibacter sp. SGAir0037]|uniref:DinB family protein n=1 Tax=Pontibacter sp. SGAir0037 TaxID=2571030 RepID=UPI0010CD09BD|nr:DinB family protein [Pontibacter sp. SGAir0037]QCR24218.1 DinB family protein [Pontibacter sp. SGAir0037]